MDELSRNTLGMPNLAYSADTKGLSAYCFQHTAPAAKSEPMKPSRSKASKERVRKANIPALNKALNNRPTDWNTQPIPRKKKMIRRTRGTRDKCSNT